MVCEIYRSLYRYVFQFTDVSTLDSLALVVKSKMNFGMFEIGGGVMELDSPGYKDYVLVVR